MEKTAEDWFKSGKEKHVDQLYKEAIEDFNQALQISPNYIDAYLMRGTSKMILGDYGAAIVDYNKVIDLGSSEFWGIYYNLGVAKEKLGDYEGAIRDYGQALKIESNIGPAYKSQGLAQSNLDDINSTVNFYDQTLKIDTDYVRLYLNRGKVKLKLGYNESALSDFEQAITLDSNNAEAYQNCGLAKLKLGNYLSAVNDFNLALNLAPNDAYTIGGRGLANLHLGDGLSAIADYNEAIRLNPKISLQYLNRSAFYFSSGELYLALLDHNRFLYITDRDDFFMTLRYLFEVYQVSPAPYLLWHSFQKFTKNLQQFNTINPVVDVIKQQCYHWHYWEEWRRLMGSIKQIPIMHYHAIALVNYYMGNCIESYRIYQEVLDNEIISKIPLNLMGLYYYIESAKLFQEEYNLILDDAIEQIEETQDELIAQSALRELYYAGQIMWANDQVVEAHAFFELADDYLPAAYMQVLTLPMTGAEETDIQDKIVNIRQREKGWAANNGFLHGFPVRSLHLEKPGADFLGPVLHYAHYREIAQAIGEVRDPSQPFQHHEMWDAFVWLPEDIKEINWLLRRERLAEINKTLLERFKANVQSGIGVHKLENLENAFAQKLKHDLWEGTEYLDFEDFKSKSDAWLDALQEVAVLIRDSRRLDLNSKLLIVEYCLLRGNISIEDSFLLYFYISYVKHAQGAGVIDEANSEGVQKIIELLLDPITVTGKVLTAAVGGALARLFGLFLSESKKKVQINMDEFQDSVSSMMPPDDFQTFSKNFLRFISYQRETLGKEAFDKQYPLRGFDDRK